MSHKILTLLLGVFTSISAFADSQPQNLTPSIPKSPQAEAFTRLGEFTVNNSYGIPDINIPLFTLESHGYKIPLTLRYEANPIKPGYNYDVYGLGWALSGASSCISRTILDLPDEDNNFKLVDQKVLNIEYSRLVNDRGSHMEYYNWRRDPFNCVLPDGSSFDFMIYNDPEGNDIKYIVSNGRHVDIKYTKTAFYVTDESGVKYTFGVTERGFNRVGTLENNHIVTWMLSRIDIPNIANPIIYEYGPTIKTEHLPKYQEPVTYFSFDRTTYDHYGRYFDPYVVTVRNEYSEDRCFFQMRLLSRISCGNGLSATFDYDINEGVGCYIHLKKLTIDDYSFTRTYRFDTEKHVLEDHGDTKVQVASLSKLSVHGADNSSDSLVYKFDYHTFFPGDLTDHWGNLTYYGGISQNNKNVGNFNLYVKADNPNYDVLKSNLRPYMDWVEKDPDDPCKYYAKIQTYNKQYVRYPTEIKKSAPPQSEGVLKSITYPTGGKAVFYYENNRFITASKENGDYEATKKKRAIAVGGGYRISKIEYYDVNNKLSDQYSYFYGPSNEEIVKKNLNLRETYGQEYCGYGEPVVDPNILTYTRLSHSCNIDVNLRYMMLGLDNYGKNNPYFDAFPDGLVDPIGENGQWHYVYELRFSSLNFQNLLAGRRPVVYSKITVYHGDPNKKTPDATESKVEYNYDIYDIQFGDSICKGSPIFNPYRINLEYDYHKCEDNKLISKTTLCWNGNSWIEKDIEKYTYNKIENSIDKGYEFQERYMSPYYPKYDACALWYKILPVHFGTLQLKSVDRTIRTAGGFKKNRIDYGYNEYNIKTGEDITEDQRQTRCTGYVYPSITDKDNDAVKWLLDRHMFNTPIGYCESVFDDVTRSEKVSNGWKIQYEKFANFYRPKFLLKRANVVDPGVKKYKLTQTVLSYSGNGNPLETVDETGMHTAYIWGYNDRYLVAQILNCTYAQAMAACNTISYRGLYGDENKISKLIDCLPNSIVRTWTYIPQVGVTSETLPNGKTFYYSYDGLGRMIEKYYYENDIVSDANKRVISRNSYNTTTK